MTRSTLIPAGLWPPRMPVEMAAGYCGEASAESFLLEVRAGTYPKPVVDRGRKKIWAKDDLDRALSPGVAAAADAALDL